MGIPKKNSTSKDSGSQEAAARSLLASQPTVNSNTPEPVTARDILPTTGTSKTKLTLTMEATLKRRLKSAAAAQETTVSELVEQWATTWLDDHVT